MSHLRPFMPANRIIKELKTTVNSEQDQNDKAIERPSEAFNILITVKMYLTFNNVVIYSVRCNCKVK